MKKQALISRKMGNANPKQEAIECASGWRYGLYAVKRSIPIKKMFTANIKYVSTLLICFILYLLLASNKFFFSSVVKLSYPDFFSFSNILSTSSD